MTTDPKALADEIERLVQGEVQRCVLNLTQEEWSTIIAALRAASSAEAMREAAAELVQDRADDLAAAYHEAHETDPDYATRLSLEAEHLRTITLLIRALPLPDPGPAPVEGWRPLHTAPQTGEVFLIASIEGTGPTLGVFEENYFRLVMNREKLRGFGIWFWQPLPPPPADPSRDAQEEPAPWPAGCIKPGSCGRHEQCMYAMSVEKCRHYGRNLAEDVHAHRKPALAAARQEGGER